MVPIPRTNKQDALAASLLSAIRKGLEGLSADALPSMTEQEAEMNGNGSGYYRPTYTEYHPPAAVEVEAAETSQRYDDDDLMFPLEM